MFLFLILTSLLIRTEANPQGYGDQQQYQEQQQYQQQPQQQPQQQGNQPYYTPYGPSAQFPGGANDPGIARAMGLDPNNNPNNPCQRSMDQTAAPMDAQQPSAVAPDSPCNQPGSENMPVEEMCSMPPDKGSGDDDVFRYYYNPVVQQCIAFSYSGLGGNANRFVSIKNCYEICHPAEPTVKKPRVVSGIKAYLVPNLKSDCKNKGDKSFHGGPKTRAPPREVVIRQIPHPLDPTKTLTIIQNAQYIDQATASKNPISLPNVKEQNIDPNVRRLYQYETVPQYVPNYQ